MQINKLKIIIKNLVWLNAKWTINELFSLNELMIYCINFEIILKMLANLIF